MMDLAQWTKLAVDQTDESFTSLDLPWTYGMILRGVKSLPIAEKTTAAVFYLLSQNSSLFQHNDLNFFKSCRFAIKIAQKTVPFQSQWIHTHLSPRLHSFWLQIEPILEDTLTLLNSADQRILLLRFYKSISINEIGSILNLSPFQVHQSILCALQELIVHFNHQGLGANIDLESLLTLMLTQVRVAPSRRLVVLVENLLLQNEPDIQVLSIARSTSKALSNAAHRLLNRLKPAAIS
jgi:hypothetical protein